MSGLLPSIDEILITRELDRRPASARHLSSEHAAYVELARVLTTTPETVLRRLVELAVELCDAGTAGVSLLQPGPAGGDGVFRWIALTGVYATSLGSSVPENFSPCGDCLRRGSLQLYSRPGRIFTNLAALAPPIVECLIVPLRSPDGLRGTVWIMTHDEAAAGFTSGDAAIMTGLAEVTAAALALQAARSRADQALRATMERVATVSHDLRASLTPALGWTDMLLSGCVTPAHAARAIAGIHSTVQRQQRLVEALSDSPADPRS